MAIKIQTKTLTIPIEIGDVTLEFDMSDENIKRLFETQNEVKKELDKIETDDFDSAAEVLKKSMDLLLGEGSFEKIHAISPSVIVISEYFWSIVNGLEQELLKRAGNNQQDKVNKFLQQKEKINKKKSKQNKK